MTRRLTMLLIGLLVVGGLAACGDDDDDTSTDTTTETTDAADDGDGDSDGLAITARDFAFEAPAEIEGGIVDVSFSNEGSTIHEAVILDIGDTSLDQFKTDFPPVLEGGPIPEYMDAVGGFFEIPAGTERTSTQALPAGEYVLWCALQTDANEEEPPEDVTGRPPHYERGMLAQITVTGGEASTDDLPTDGGTVTAVETSADAYTFEVDGLSAGTNEVAFVNADSNNELHFLLVQAFPAGTTEEQATEAFQTLLNLEEGQAPPEGTAVPEDVGGTSVFSPGYGGTAELTLTSGGTYIAVCFIQDRTGGPPHAIGKGMAKVFTVA
jgi:hypothetical protein